MIAGGLVSRFLHCASLGFLSRLRFLGNEGARFAASGVALAGESFVFELLHRGLNPGKNERGFLEAWRASFINFGMLQGCAFLMRAQSGMFRHLAQDFGMVLGNEALRIVEGGPAASNSWLERLAAAEACNLSLGLGMALVQAATGHRLAQIEAHLNRPRQVASKPSFDTHSLRSSGTFAAEGDGMLLTLRLRDRAFLADSLQKINSVGFRPGVTPARLERYRRTLHEMQGFKLGFAEGRGRLIEILKEDWIEKCGQTGGECRRIRLDQFLDHLRRNQRRLPAWIEAYVAESEANAALEVIAIAPSDKRGLGWEENLEKIEEEEYLGFHFGSATDQQLITSPLGLGSDALSEPIIDMSEMPPP